MRDDYDFVIVGGGSAGCVLANRLSADPANQVLVLEAGRPDYRWDVYIHMPAALSFPIGNRFYDWKYESEPEPHMGDRRIYHARGKVLGGSSSINGMIFQRGNPLDFERWGADPGMMSWDYAHCLPYFKRMENCLAPTDGGEYRGDDGPLVLERGPATNPLFRAFLDATVEAGHPRTTDVNGARQEGFNAFDRNVHRGRRLSASRAYLHPVKERANLDIVTRALTTKVLFEGGRAVGVEYERLRRRRTVKGAEIILCGGAINSPQLLQLSGVGPAPLLGGHGIEVVADIAGVGQNLQDHLEVYIQHTCTKPVSIQHHLALWKRPWIGLQWLFRRGPGATNHFEAGGFIRSNDDVAYPNLMFHFLPIAIRYDGSTPEGGHGYQVHVGPMYSDARGSVEIKSANPRDKPALRFNYLSTEQDRREWVEAVRHARRILGQPAMAPFDGGEVSPGPDVRTDEDILDWVGSDAETALHPSCTTKMGFGPDAVLEPSSLRVHGVDGLRVVDAVRDQRQHLRARDDACREGRRPDPRQRAATRRDGRFSSPRTRLIARVTGVSCDRSLGADQCRGTAPHEPRLSEALRIRSSEWRHRSCHVRERFDPLRCLARCPWSRVRHGPWRRRSTQHRLRIDPHLPRQQVMG